MAINIIPLNGESPLIDYKELEHSFIHFLGEKCSEATMYVMNRFPAPVSPENNIDILFLMSLNDIHGNYTRYENKIAEFDYFRNAIIPVTIKSHLENSEIKIQDSFLKVDDFEYDGEDDFTSVKFGLINFLTKKCDFDRSKLHIQPIQLLLNKKVETSFRHYLIGQQFNAHNFFKIIKLFPSNYFQSYKAWLKSNGYVQFKSDATTINEASSFASEYGYLTRKKIERIEGQLLRDSAMYNSIGNQPTKISGKAGTGKTAHLLHLLIRCLKNNRNITFLTYNHLLTKEIAYQVKVVQNSLYKRWATEGLDTSHFSTATVQTLMGFIYRLSKSFGVLLIMSEERVKELESVLRRSLNYLVENLPSLFQQEQNSSKIFKSGINWQAAVEAIQNSIWEVPVKQYGIAFLWFLQKNNKSMTNELSVSANLFYTNKIIQLIEMNNKNVFIQDYIGCLKKTLDTIRNTETFYNEHNVKNKYELLEDLMDLNKRKQDEDLANRQISLAMFTKRIKNVVKGRTTKKRILMVDEAQDCHSYEREIFYEMFKPENVVVSYGGQEQLIRFAETCKWEMFRNKVIDVKSIGSGNNSYRIKQNILDFCNFITDRHKIDLKLKSYNEEDSGQIIFDFRPQEEVFFGTIFSKLLEKGSVNGCNSLESLMILDVNKHDNKNEKNEYNIQDNLISVVNEYDVLEDEGIAKYEDFDYLDELNKHSEYWVGAVANKQDLTFPSPNEVRVINYESCRGLESWCVMCLNIDSFYSARINSDDAKRFLLSEGVILTANQREAMYAITWILMAATRAIDTLYLQMMNKENEFTKLCLEYAKANPGRCNTFGLDKK